MDIPHIGSELTQDQLSLLESFAKSCRKSIIGMVKNSQSGHPGGSLSTLDYLALIYTQIIGQTGEDVVVSHGHVSPAVYSVLAEMGYIPKEDVIRDFRKIGAIYEGHITRHVPGVTYGTGPLGVGVSAAASFAHAEKLNKTGKYVYAAMGDGEAQEGQVHEMMHYAAKYKLNNLVLFVDYNRVQLTDAINDVMPINIEKVFAAGGWNVIAVDGHNFQEMWDAIGKAHQETERPTVLVGCTIMGQGAPGMEEEGQAIKATWHGKAPSPEMADEILEKITITDEDCERIDTFKKTITWHPAEPKFPQLLSAVEINVGEPIVYAADVSTDCRSAYGKALLDLAKNNSNVLAMTADLRGSVMTKFVAEELPEQHIEHGIAEQNMVTCCGAMSLKKFVPFCSTFGAFMSSRAKDQARVNDINQCNAKMVATHCGLSVGEDGPTHQAIDDKGSFLGMFNTMIIEPADPNQTDRIIRYIASHWGNFYVRMGRHKFPVITKEDGTPFYGADYMFEYGKCDAIREGSQVTIAASGASINEALIAREKLIAEGMNTDSIEIIAVSSMKKFDDTLKKSLEKTKGLITVEDHNTYSGLAGQIARFCEKEKIILDHCEYIGVEEYQLSGKVNELYAAAGIDSDSIVQKVKNMV